MSPRQSIIFFLHTKGAPERVYLLYMECSTLRKEGRNPLAALCRARRVSWEECCLTEWEMYQRPVPNLAILMEQVELAFL